ncbi:hypothetical protein ILUMI_24696 [Ignelater luminosus]|uniref:Uncharacterized protein n=1 Tax=Ignelater luminosus TaxID=2038154 RepID=A0A8K0CBE4_IGNLU|nr:hypothetical protein ILUMI_24696 [Ignelater luminosus]
MAPLNPDSAIRAATLLQEGRSQQYVANLFGVNQSPDLLDVFGRLAMVQSGLNPIEHLWNYMGNRLQNRRSRIYTINELLEALQEEWENIDPNFVQTLIESMPRRLQAVIRAREILITVLFHLMLSFILHSLNSEIRV